MLFFLSCHTLVINMTGTCDPKMMKENRDIIHIHGIICQYAYLFRISYHISRFITQCTVHIVN